MARMGFLGGTRTRRPSVVMPCAPPPALPRAHPGSALRVSVSLERPRGPAFGPCVESDPAGAVAGAEAQLDAMVRDVERDLGRSFEARAPGAPALPVMSYTLDPLPFTYVPLFVYAVTHGIFPAVSRHLLRTRGFIEHKVPSAKR
jgi:hypothetical protein